MNTNKVTKTEGADLSKIGMVVAQRTAKEVDPFENTPTFVPGKNLAAGRVLAGLYIRTKRVFSEKLTAGKIDPKTGRRYRDLHVLEDATSGQKFGIWSTGQLAAVLPRLSEGQYVEIEYTGLATKSLKPGQSPAHQFKVRVEGQLNDLPAYEDDSALDTGRVEQAN